MVEHAADFPIQHPEERRGSSRRIFFLVIFVGALLTLLTLAVILGYYVVTRQPVTELPGVEVIARPIPPRRVFSFAGIAKPVGIAVSPDGQRVYVSEGGGDRLIKVFDREGRKVGEMEPPDSRPGTRKPGHLALDADGRIYAADRLRGVIDVYGPNLRWERVVASAEVDAQGGWIPNGVSVGPDGRIYVPDIGPAEHSVVVLAPDGKLLGRLDKGVGLPGGQLYPVQAVADEEGRTYIAYGNGGRVVAYSPRGVGTVGVSGDETVSVPVGLTVTGRKLFVADAGGHQIVVFTLGDRPTFLHSFGDTDDGEGLAFPSAVAVDRTGRIYVADRVNDRVQVWSY